MTSVDRVGGGRLKRERWADTSFTDKTRLAITMRYRPVPFVGAFLILQLLIAACFSMPVPTTSPLRSPLSLPTPSPIFSNHPAPVLDFGWTCSAEINCVYDLLFDQDGDLWAGGGGGVARWNFKDGKYSRTLYTTADGLASGDIRDAVLAPDGSLWFAGFGISRYKDGRWTSFKLADSLPWRNVGAITTSSNGTVWIGGWEYAGPVGIARFDQDRWITYDLGESLYAEKFPYALALAHDGTLWVGTYGAGAFHFVAGVDGTYTLTQELSNKSVWDIATGHDGTLWFGTYGNGVYSFDGKTWTHYTEKDGLPSNRVTSIATAPDGTIWFATGKGIAQFDGEKLKGYIINDHLEEGVPYKNVVSAITVAPNGKIWIATVDGIFQFSP